MKDPSVPWRLQAASFFCGAAVMIMELTGSRLVAPFLGTSLIVWTALIGVIMMSLCLGNWIGGHVADRRPEAKILARVLMAAALVTALTALGANALLAWASGASFSLYAAAVVAALVAFAPASVLMGMCPPIIARLAMCDVASSGATVGRLSALNSAGSILGTFLGGFVLISFFPSGVILIGVAAGLMALSLVVYAATWRGILLLAALVGLSGWTCAYGLPMAPVGVHIDTRYNHISIVESRMSDGRRVRIMMTDPDGAQSVMCVESPTDLISDYTKFYDLAFHFKPDAKKILMLGGGGWCVPRHVLAERDVSFDVVELDPGMTEAARTYFGVPDGPAVQIYHEDARTFLARAARDGLGPWDAVFMDVFGSWYSIPFHMATVEAAGRVRDVLAPDGVLVVNVISALYGPRSGVFHGIWSAFSRAFPKMMIFPASAPDPRYAQARQNLMIVALRSDEDPPVPPAPEPGIARLLSHQWIEPFVPDPRVPAFTDAFAPVERWALAQGL